MAYTAPTVEPESFVQGDTVTWTISLPDFPASTWTLSYDFVQESDHQTVTAAADGDDYTITITTGESAVFETGTYKFQAYVTSGSTRYTLNGERGLPMRSGRVEVIADFATNTTGYDARTDYEEMRADAVAAYKTYLANQTMASSYSIGERTMSFNSPQEILDLIRKLDNHILDEKAKERLKQGKGHPGKLNVRF